MEKRTMDLYLKLEKMSKCANKLLNELLGEEEKIWLEATFGKSRHDEIFPPERINLRIAQNFFSETKYEYESRRIAECFPTLKEADMILWFAIELLQTIVNILKKKN